MLDLIMLDAHEAELRAMLTTEDGSEAAAYVLLAAVNVAVDRGRGPLVGAL